MNTVNLVACCVGRIIQYPKDIFTKRLQKRRRSLITECTQKVKDKGPQCTCCKCANYRNSQRKRVIEPDFFASLAYQHRMAKSKQISKVKNINLINPCSQDNTNPGKIRCKRNSDHRDVPITASTGWSWWTNVNSRRYMPPMYHPCKMPSKSECSSSNSGFRTATPNIDSLNELLQSDKTTSETSIMTNNRSIVEIEICTRKNQNRSRSDSRVILRSDKKNNVKRLTRSASAKTTSLKKKQKSRRLFNVRRKRCKPKSSRKVNRLLSHASLNNFSTAVCYSKTIIKK